MSSIKFTAFGIHFKQITYDKLVLQKFWILNNSKAFKAYVNHLLPEKQV